VKENGSKATDISHLDLEMLLHLSDGDRRVYEIMVKFRMEGPFAVIKAAGRQGKEVAFCGAGSAEALMKKLWKAGKDGNLKFREDVF
jgi:hypothetical protein